jgi:hypothetical protein
MGCSEMTPGEKAAHRKFRRFSIGSPGEIQRSLLTVRACWESQ